MPADQLPVSAAMPALFSALAEHPSAVLCAPPGSGKTTRVPLELMQAPWLKQQRILLLEPRRLAARAAANHMAGLLGEQTGARVGYSIRLERQVCADTRIEVVTEGILTRRLQSDPELTGVGLVIFDEFHERNLQTDLGLALALDAQQGLREDLRLLVMSATLDSGWVSQLLGDAPVIEAQGRSHPVQIRYLDKVPDRRRIAEQTVDACCLAYPETAGDLLVFLPGVREIREAASELDRRLASHRPTPLIMPLFGDLPKAEQERALQPDAQGRRRLVLTTAIAETSLTIEGVTTVVDSGWSRLPVFLPGPGLTRLETRPVSRASATQRAGRAGRLGPGRCYRLWSEEYQQRLPAYHPAEILQADLAPLALELARWGVSDPDQLRWPETPPKPAYRQAVTLLQGLGALDEQQRVSALGERMARLPLHPRLAHMLLRAGQSQRHMASDLAALLSERDILMRKPGSAGTTDVALRLRLLAAWREQPSAGGSGLNTAACRQLDRLSRDWLRRLQQAGGEGHETECSVGQLLALAYPDRIAEQTRHARFRLAGGRGVRLAEEDPLAAEPYLVAAQLDAGDKEGWVRLAAAISLQEIRSLPDLPIERRNRVYWEASSQRVRAITSESLGAVVLSQQPWNDPDPEAQRQALLQGIGELGLSVLPWSKSLRGWQARLAWLRQALDDAGLPDLSDDWLLHHLEEWLAPWLDGITQPNQLQRLDLDAILRNTLSWEQQQLLDREAPSHLRVPSGSNIPLSYSSASAPVLAVRLQELFGLTETPRVGQGRVPVMLHLLSPARRPMQITDDLAGFWQRTYPEVKKELKGRYPKHYWPDDPLSAVATARTKPKR